ncbi:hypothetical protein RO3G_07514 [Rhizopus delemar RA 99-880]|uniref:HSF-type DNA-binding domain-containing protein n=1 Tax=Rhizopus delemar (strain RA 99-880 / ATCC MYA-4621 / FGSC 9543 / NRRL 43880) TaxID=246409 RepID=I1C2X9_RHIO9|nr:hypothetical protein RO3G_07514 [Rhizopus delemar RA 99-880]|eukprot:EIE82809.1 hypothetical protein RO3G_07514 [Rhizopus delemar RA 99-880]
MFIIDNIPEFTETVLPKLFKHCKFASFDSKGRDTCRWYHKYFRPGRRDLFHLIRRKPPRYSRGRRQQRVDKNSEVILSMESEDEVSEIQGPAILSPSTTLTPSTQYQPLYYPTDLPSSYSISQPLAQKEAFQNQLACLQEKYTRVYTVLTDEINRAYSFIEAQKSRIKFLENSLQQQGSLNDPVPLAYRSPSSSSVDGTNMVLQSHCHETYSTPLYNIIQQSYLSPSRSSSSTGHMNPQSMYMLSNEDLQGIPTSNSLLQNDDNSLLL